MSKYSVTVERHYTYEVIVDAPDGDEAREMVREFDIEELEPFEVDAYFEFEFGVEINE